MLNSINNEASLILNPQLQQGEQLSASEEIQQKKKKNPYESVDMFVDKGDISKQALELFEKEKDIQKYKGLLDGISEEEANQQVASLLETGAWDISDDEIAESMMLDDELLKELF